MPPPITTLSLRFLLRVRGRLQFQSSVIFHYLQKHAGEVKYTEYPIIRVFLLKYSIIRVRNKPVPELFRRQITKSGKIETERPGKCDGF